jgi:sulfate/thiosulfate transport system permease protein
VTVATVAEAPGAHEAHPAAARAPRRARLGLGVGVATLYLSAVVLVPLGAIVVRAGTDGWSSYWRAVTTPESWAALRLTLLLGLAVAAVNAVFGTLIAWVLVRDDFRGRRAVDALIDLPFALPTIVAGLVLLALYGPTSPLHVNLAYARTGVMAALLFVTLPFVVRTVQPVLIEFDAEMEEAAASLGASRPTIFRRIVLPNLVPAIAAGTALSFARAISEFGATVLISGNIPFKTEVASVHIFSQVESDNTVGAAAVSTVLLLASLVVLTGLQAVKRWAVRRG